MYTYQRERDSNKVDKVFTAFIHFSMQIRSSTYSFIRNNIFCSLFSMQLPWNMSDYFAIFLEAPREAEQAQTKNSTHHNLLTQRWCKLWTVCLPWLLQIPFWHLEIKRLQQPAHLNALLSKYKLWFGSLLGKTYHTNCWIRCYL